MCVTKSVNNIWGSIMQSSSAVFLLVLVAVISPLQCRSSTGIRCMDNDGNPVDWFIVYKLPKIESSSNPRLRDGVGQAYMDTNNQQWRLLDEAVNQSSNYAIYNTLQQIYANADSEGVAYLMYNDENPDGTVSSARGHTKGDVAFDSSSGFWLIHSVPKFPPPASAKYDYPSTGMIYGQTFLCISLSYADFNNIGNQLFYNYPNVYDLNLPTKFKNNTHVVDVVNGKHVSSQPWYNLLKFSSLKGQPFVSFAKYTNFGRDLYDSWVAPYLQTDLMVETWQRKQGGITPSNCTAKYKVMNVESLKILGVAFKETEDHSKWAVASSSSSSLSSSSSPSSQWICIGDINRMDSQKKRAGGTVCTVLSGVWKSFSTAITKADLCSQQNLHYNHL